MRNFFLSAVAVCVMAVAVQAADVDRASVPSDKELAYPRSIISELFGQRIKIAKLAPDKVKLAGELIDLASTSTGNAERYALLEHAKDLAIEAKDMTVALRSLDLMAEHYNVDKEVVRKQILSELAGKSDKDATVIARMDALVAQAKAEPDKLGQIADTFYNLSKTLRGPLQTTAKAKAIEYYNAALPKLAGLEKMKAEARVKELSVKSTKAVDVKRLKRDANLDVLVGTWEVRIAGGKYTSQWTFYPNGTLYNSREKTTDAWTVANGMILVGNGGDAILLPLNTEGTAGHSAGAGKAALIVRKILK